MKLNRRDVMKSGLALPAAAWLPGKEAKASNFYEMPAIPSAKKLAIPSFVEEKGMLTYDEMLQMKEMLSAWDRWKDSPMIASLKSEKEQMIMSTVLENQRTFMELEQRDVQKEPILRANDAVIWHFGLNDDLRRLAIPIAYETVKKLFEARWLPLLPMTNAVNSVYYWKNRPSRQYATHYYPACRTKNSEDLNCHHFYSFPLWETRSDEEQIRIYSNSICHQRFVQRRDGHRE